jgi:hypothetical protein
MRRQIQGIAKHPLGCDGYFKTNRAYKRQAQKASRQAAKKEIEQCTKSAT